MNYESSWNSCVSSTSAKNYYDEVKWTAVSDSFYVNFVSRQENIILYGVGNIRRKIKFRYKKLGNLNLQVNIPFPKSFFTTFHPLKYLESFKNLTSPSQKIILHNFYLFSLVHKFSASGEYFFLFELLAFTV